MTDIKHIWFDLDGTLTIHTPEFHKAHNELRYKTYAEAVKKYGWQKVDDGWLTGDYDDAPTEAQSSNVEAKLHNLAKANPNVDYVVIFNEVTPRETIRALKPNVLIKGGDYKISQIVGRDDVEKVVRFPLVKNVSTTGLIQKIVKTYGGKI